MIRSVIGRKSKTPKRVKKKKLRKHMEILNSINPIVSVIIPVMNERRTIAQVIRSARMVHADTEVIVVSNGSTDGTERIAKRSGAKVIYHDQALGHDVGRSIGAKEARGNILLFLDGDFIVNSRELRPLVKAVENGTDVALNSYLGPTRKQHVHQVIAAKHVLNIMLYRPDLKGVSMTTIPHAMSRTALEHIGTDNLAIPPKAHAIAVHKGLKVEPIHYIPVGIRNRKRIRKKNSQSDPLGNLIIGDHLEAIHWLIEATNSRGNHTDLTRLREKLR